MTLDAHYRGALVAMGRNCEIGEVSVTPCLAPAVAEVWLEHECTVCEKGRKVCQTHLEMFKNRPGHPCVHGHPVELFLYFTL